MFWTRVGFEHWVTADTTQMREIVLTGRVVEMAHSVVHEADTRETQIPVLGLMA